MTGPSFKGLFGKSESLTDGSTVTVDENYLSTSIRNPMQQVVAGYPPVMPPIAASDAEVDALVQFVKSQK